MIILSVSASGVHMRASARFTSRSFRYVPHLGVPNCLALYCEHDSLADFIH
jgi:hypothetical protein